MLGVCYAPRVKDLNATIDSFFASPWACDFANRLIDTDDSEPSGPNGLAQLRGPAALAGIRPHCLVVDTTPEQASAQPPTSDYISYAQYTKSTAGQAARLQTAEEEDAAYGLDGCAPGAGSASTGSVALVPQ